MSRQKNRPPVSTNAGDERLRRGAAIRTLENPALAAIPIFAMTANAFDTDREQAFASGMNGHIAKPIDTDQLEDALRSVLQ